MQYQSYKNYVNQMRRQIRLKVLAVINLMNWPGYASLRYPVSYGPLLRIQPDAKVATLKSLKHLYILLFNIFINIFQILIFDICMYVSPD